MPNNALCKNDLQTVTIDSREVSVMTGKEHKHLRRDIKNYIDVLGQSNIGHSDFFIPSTYTNSQNKEQPCYLLTKKGCDLVANKMTGEKGIIFTAKYVTRFEEMESLIKQPQKLMSMEEVMIRSLEEQLKIKQKMEIVQQNTAIAVSRAERVEEKLDKQMTINSTQQKHIQDAVKKKVSERLNRCKEFNNLFDTGDHKAQFFSSLYGDLKRRFGVPTYKDILYINYDDALGFVKAWIEPADIRG